MAIIVRIRITVMNTKTVKLAVENLAMTKYITCDPSMRVFQEAPRKPLY